MNKVNGSGSNNNYLNNIFFSSYTKSYIFIFDCLFNIGIAYYGDYLIINYKLEEKYPKLAKWIKLRRKFQHYYIGLNLLLISIALLFVIYVNFTVLKYTPFLLAQW